LVDIGDRIKDSRSSKREANNAVLGILAAAPPPREGRSNGLPHRGRGSATCGREGPRGELLQRQQARTQALPPHRLSRQPPVRFLYLSRRSQWM
ncbi:hypothetical protein BHE74_00007601, partial [Ensete ventricosum]